MMRKVTMTYELPEDLCGILEEKAAIEGRTFEEVVAEHLRRHPHSRRPLTPQEADRCKAAFHRHLGAWSSGRADSSANHGIDADLAKEYRSGGVGGT
jgi:hypothetical protein